MKHFALVCFATFLILPTASAADAVNCRKLFAVSYEPEPGNDYLRSAEEAYRDCRSDKLPMDIRIEAYVRYADVKLVQGETQTGIGVYRDALGVLDSSNGANSALTIDLLDRLARAENSAHLSSDALTHARRALDMRTVQYGPESTETALGLARLGMAYVDQREYVNADRFIRDAIRVAGKSCGPSCDALSEAYAAMSVWYGDQGKEAEAARYSELSIAAIPLAPSRKSTRKE